MRAVFVNNRATAESFVSDLPWAAIQITDPGGQWPELSTARRRGVLQLRFPDRDAPDEAFPEPTLFSETQASEILDFVQEHQARIVRLLVHCEEGANRSAAVAAALTRVFLPDADWGQFFERRSPNILVFGRLMTEAQRRGLFKAAE